MSVSPLEVLQRRFIGSVLKGTESAFAASVTGGGKLSAAEAVEVYRKGYPARLTEALGETFEACWRVMGDDDFFAACRDYIERIPSRSHNLSDYGDEFPAFLEARAQKLQAPFLGSLARYEWEFKNLFHDGPHSGLAPAALAAAAKPNSVLRFGTATRLLSFPHRVYGIWKRDRSDDSLLEESDWTGNERLLLYKNGGNEIFVRELTVPEHDALAALASGRTLELSLYGTNGLDDAMTKDLFVFLASNGLVAEVR